MTNRQADIKNMPVGNNAVLSQDLIQDLVQEEMLRFLGASSQAIVAELQASVRNIADLLAMLESDLKDTKKYTDAMASAKEHLALINSEIDRVSSFINDICSR